MIFRFLFFVYSLLVSGHSVFDTSYVALGNDRDILLTYNTAVALYGQDYADLLRNQGLITYPDDPQYAYLDDISTSRIRLWSDQGRNIPYTISDPALTEVVRDAVTRISEETRLIFVPRTSQRNYINFVYSGNCGGVSYIGMIGGGQRVTMPTVTSCFGSLKIASGVTQHEILHALGFSHQQSYPDRDNYVRILRQNIQDTALFNFEKRQPNIIDSFNLPYDYKSIMHYKSRTFSKNGGYTITKIDGSVPPNDFGGNDLSDIDIIKINRLYPFEEPTPRLPTPRPPTPRPPTPRSPTPNPTLRSTPQPTLRPTRPPITLPTLPPISFPTPPPTIIVTPAPTINKGNCYTIGEKCVFPFRFRGRTYYSCTNNFDPDNRFWCSTRVNSNGVHIRGNWGYCEQTCQKVRGLDTWFVDYIEADSGECIK